MSLAVSETNINATILSAVESFLNVNQSLALLRKGALDNFQRLGLPTQKHEEYKHTPLTRLLEKNFSFASPNPALATSSFDSSYLIPEVEGSRLVFINGAFSKEHSFILAEDGLTVTNLAAALAEGNELLNQYLGSIADHASDGFIAWNTASWTDGTLIKVDANKIIKRPICIYHLHDATAGQIVSATRNLVIVDRNAEVTIVEKFDTHGSANGFSSLVAEALVAENAGLTWYSIQNDSGSRYQFDLKQIHQAKSSRVKTFTFTLNGKLVRNNLHLALDGENIDSHMYGLYLVGKDTIADNHTVVDHKQPHSYSNELYKGIIEDSAKGVFNGKIYVRPNAQKTNAFQANRNILLTDRASVNTKPQLEIWADDVKCSHGCTSGQLDEEALFYLQARGISKDTARAMMLYAFAGELLSNIPHEGLRNYIDSLVSERLHKNF